MSEREYWLVFGGSWWYPEGGASDLLDEPSGLQYTEAGAIFAAKSFLEGRNRCSMWAQVAKFDPVAGLVVVWDGEVNEKGEKSWD